MTAVDDIQIRAATARDIPAIAAIYADAVVNGTASYELEPPDEAEMASRHAGIAAAGYPYLAAERAGAVIGYAYASPFRPRRAYRFTVEDSIYLAPAARGLGLGRRLLHELVVSCTQLGFRQMVAVIGDGAANAASVRLHAAAGFSPAGVLVGSGWKHGRWVDTVFMQLALNEGHLAPPSPDALPERSQT